MKKPIATLTLSKQTLKTLQVRSAVQAGMTIGVRVSASCTAVCPKV